MLRATEHGVDRAKDARAVSLECIEGAGRRETFQHALVDGARINPCREVSKIGKRAVLPRGNDCFHRLLADAFERGERIDNGVAVDFEINCRNG